MNLGGRLLNDRKMAWLAAEGFFRVLGFGVGTLGSAVVSTSASWDSVGKRSVFFSCIILHARWGEWECSDLWAVEVGQGETAEAAVSEGQQDLVATFADGTRYLHQVMSAAYRVRMHDAESNSDALGFVERWSRGRVQSG